MASSLEFWHPGKSLAGDCPVGGLTDFGCSLSTLLVEPEGSTLSGLENLVHSLLSAQLLEVTSILPKSTIGLTEVGV